MINFHQVITALTAHVMKRQITKW